jgi:hypothetical protein
MDLQAVFGLSILMSFVAFGVMAARYLWPRLQRLPRHDALGALVVPHTFRFIGLSFLVPRVVSPTLPSAFAAPAAYGDLVAAILAVAASLALSRHASWALGLVWLFNVWGTADLLYAFYQGLCGVQMDARALGTAFFIPTAVVPPLLMTHGLIGWLLLRKRPSGGAAHARTTCRLIRGPCRLTRHAGNGVQRPQRCGGWPRLTPKGRHHDHRRGTSDDHT